MNKLVLLFLGLFFTIATFAQTDQDVLMTVDGEPILAKEFLRVYNKNLDLVQDESQKDIDGYLELFVEYQLKLKEAKRLKLDEESKYVREFGRYKKQLTKNYLSESKVTESLVKEAFERSNMDINASHVLVRLDEAEKDTLQAYDQVLKLRQRVLNEGFETVKADVHDGKNIFLEDLGYFSAFKMVYDFETQAYNTPVGEISMPFRTQFGYHVVIVKDKRASRGSITAAHIMVSTNQKDSTIIPEKRINEIYAKYKQGESFESLARQFSDDKSSARNGGKLASFKSGQLSSVEFEDQAFGLASDGEVSKPFKTSYGWHIVKRISLEPNKSFEEVKPLLENRIKRDSRSKLINEAMVDELINRYQVVYNENAKADFQSIVTKDYLSGQWQFPDTADKDEMIFKVNSKTFTYGDFARHLKNAQRVYMNKKTSVGVIIDKEYDSFFEKSILQYREDNLEMENEDFANILKEYRDGLLLFDLMEKEIWNKAAKDSVGLESFYNENKDFYKWPKRVDVMMLSTADQKVAIEARKMLLSGRTQDEMDAKFNTGGSQNVMVTNAIYPISSDKLPSDFNVKEGVTRVYKHNDAFHVFNVKAVLPDGQKSFEEAKGSVISDYQTELESQWISSLKSRFEVVVNEDVLNRIKSELNN